MALMSEGYRILLRIRRSWVQILENLHCNRSVGEKRLGRGQNEPSTFLYLVKNRVSATVNNVTSLFSVKMPNFLSFHQNGGSQTGNFSVEQTLENFSDRKNVDHQSFTSSWHFSLSSKRSERSESFINVQLMPTA